MSKKAGLHLDNNTPIDNPTKEYMIRMDPNCILVTGNSPPEDIEWCHNHFPDAVIICRVVFQRGMSYVGYFASTLTLWRMVRQFYPNKQVIVQLFNEPQFSFEGWGQTEDDIKSFYETWLWGHDWLKGSDGASEMLFGFTPMAPGNQDLPIIEEPGRRTFLEYCQDLLAMCEYMFIHVYAEYPEQVEDPWVGGRMVQYKKWSQGKPIYITESAIGTKDQTTRGPDTVRWFKKWIENDPQILGVTQWLGNAPGNPAQDPSFDVNRHFDGGGFPREVYHHMLEYLAEPVIEPEPPIQPPTEGEGNLTLAEQHKDIYDQWVLAGGIENNLRKHLLGIGAIEPTAQDLKFLADEAGASITQLRTALAKFPFK